MKYDLKQLKVDISQTQIDMCSAGSSAVWHILKYLKELEERLEKLEDRVEELECAIFEGDAGL
ncbi:MAG: hypothetical protein DRP01_02440 [Archaeoglobales archaeon]|nr:MAG: hypothetical protein DRP01_02440 [Archaeoglobales archaeon]